MSHLAMLAPPWIPIPPPAYGGIEQVVRLSPAGLVDAGHRVTLFARRGRGRRRRCARRCRSRTRTRSSSRCGRSTTSRAASTRSTRPPTTATRSTSCTTTRASPRWRWRDRLQTPLVHTLHGPFEPDLFRFYACHGAKAQLVAISAAQRDAAPEHLRDEIAVVHNPLAVDEWPFTEAADGYLLWIARMNDDKGPQRAIAAARAAGAAAGARGAGPAWAGGVLRARGRAAHRRRRRALRRRGRRGRTSASSTRAPGRC